MTQRGLTRRRLIVGVAVAAASAESAFSVGIEVNVRAFGAKGDGVTDDSEAFHAACRRINSAGGGVLVIPAGTYLWGNQEFAGRSGMDYAFRGPDLISISDCTGPVVVRSHGVVLKNRAGLKYGSFDPSTGQARTAKAPFLDRDWRAMMGSALVFDRNADVTVEGPLELDGASSEFVFGGEWGDTGRQLPHSGIVARNNRRFRASKVHAHHFALDGCMIAWTGLTAANPSYPHSLEDCEFMYNGRQGLSWVGGNALDCENCDFSHTGKDPALASAPGAGLDIEAEEAICRNGRFVRCRFKDNSGAGMVADSGDSADCRFEDCEFVATRFWGAWPRKPRISFIRCRFNGPIVNAYGSRERPADSAKFIDCQFAHDPRTSPTQALYEARSDLSSGYNVRFESCRFTVGEMGPPPCAGGVDGVQWIDCQFQTNTDRDFYTRGVFEGRCRIDTVGRGKWDPGGSAVIRGDLTLNGRLLPKTRP